MAFQNFNVQTPSDAFFEYGLKLTNREDEPNDAIQSARLSCRYQAQMLS